VELRGCGGLVRDVPEHAHLRDVETADFDLGADAEHDDLVEDLEEDQGGTEGPHEADRGTDDLSGHLADVAVDQLLPVLDVDSAVQIAQIGQQLATCQASHKAIVRPVRS